MRIGEAAAQAGVNIQTLRYYERRGLLPRPARQRSGYRDVHDETVRMVRFIKRAQDLGFSLNDAAALLRLRNERGRDRRRVQAVARARLAEVDQKIQRLQAMRDALAKMLHACEQGHSIDCPIIEALEVEREAHS